MKIRTLRKHKWLPLFSLLLPLSAQANTPKFDDITAGDYEKIVKELSANFAYSTITPASSLGSVWGAEIGVVGGITKTPEILTLVKRADPQTKLKDDFPHASILGRVGIPYGVTFEALVIPKKTISDLSFKQTGGSVMWTLTDVVLTELPVSLAVKGFYSKTTLGFAQTIQNSSTSNIPVRATIEFASSVMGATALTSYKWMVFEPYAGIGYLRSKGELSVNAAGSATIFNQTFSGAAGRRAVSKPNSLQLLGGLDVKLAFFSLGAEYQRSFGTYSYTGRVSFRF